MVIHYLQHDAIDKSRWDDCINLDSNHLPYGYSWWLDSVSPGWEALVSEDYTLVMPLTCRRKYGIDYLFQPFFTQKLGIFSTSAVSDRDVNLFLESIPKRYRWIYIQLNNSNPISIGSGKIIYRNNYELDLSPGYTYLQSAYHRNCRRNIQKAHNARLKVKPVTGVDVFVHFVRNNLHDQIENNSPELYGLLNRIVSESIRRNRSEILGVFNPSGKMLAAGWFVKNQDRIMFMVCASGRDGKKNQAMYLLVDTIIRENAGTGQIFDFTGSDLPGVAYFNSGFGATKKMYPALKRNTLPWYLKWLKR